jgi:hypothetical protein
LELLNCAVACFDAVELDHSYTPGTTGWLEADLSTLDFADRGE